MKIIRSEIIRKEICTNKMRRRRDLRVISRATMLTIDIQKQSPEHGPAAKLFLYTFNKTHFFYYANVAFL